MLKQILSLIGLGLAATTSAQVSICDYISTFHSVTNEGVAVGTSGQNKPFFLWDTKTNEVKVIGGKSSGDEGGAGRARFRADGKVLAAPCEFDHIPVNSEWRKTENTDYDFHFNGFAFQSNYALLAVGASADGKSGIVLKSANNGISWQRCDDSFEGGIKYENETGWRPQTGLYSIASVGYGNMYIGGGDGMIFYGKGNSEWHPCNIHPENDNTEVSTYWAMDFMIEKGEINNAQYGCVGLESTDGKGYVWYTNDQAESFHAATGVVGIPSCIKHNGELFFMTTKNGHIQMSVDFGATWEDIFSTEDGAPLYRIYFADENKGIATSDNVVYLTTDGGDTWEKTSVLPDVSATPFSTVTWNDAVWVEDVITVIGSQGCVYRSYDNGANFEVLALGNATTNDYCCMYFDRDVYNIIAENGTFFYKSDISHMPGVCAGMYDVENETWTPLESFGYIQDYNAGAPWQISGDGNTVVGNAPTYSYVYNGIQVHATAWGNGKSVDLGSLFEKRNRASTAMASNYDGSIIVGWQDIFGPRFGTYWTRNEDNSYTQHMMFKDENKTEADINPKDQTACMADLVGTARSVSPDGKWIGGDGTTMSAFIGAWLWNEDEGYISIFEDEPSSVADVLNDGKMAIGWQGQGSSAWMWTKDNGVQFLQDYATDVLGADLGDFYIASSYDISPNGRYITGVGFIGNDMYGYVIDLEHNTSSIDNKTMRQVEASIYPNPVADELHVDLPFSADEVNTVITLTNISGQTVRRINAAAQSNSINVNNLTDGIYVLDVNAQGNHKSFKVIVRH